MRRREGHPRGIINTSGNRTRVSGKSARLCVEYHKTKTRTKAITVPIRKAESQYCLDADVLDPTTSFSIQKDSPTSWHHTPGREA
jgi:hypothetical protein